MPSFCRCAIEVFQRPKVVRSLTWLGVAILLFLAALKQQMTVLSWPLLKAPLMPDDSDVWLRLNQVRQWITGGSFYDHSVPRTNAPFGGISIHWTRPLDAIEAALYHLTPATWPIDIRLMSMAAWLPALLSLLIIFFAAKAAEQRMKHSLVFWCAAVMAAFSPLKDFYLAPGNADHHGLLCLLWTCALCLIVGNWRHSSAALTGILLGIVLWMDIEGLLPIGCVFIVLGLRALMHPDDMKPLATLTVALFLTVFAALFVEMPPYAALHQEMYDTLSLVQVVLMGLVAAGACLLAPLFSRLSNVFMRAAAAGFMAALATGAMWVLFPKFFLGPMADTDMAVSLPFLNTIHEMAPIWRVPAPSAVSILAAPVLAAALCLLTWHRGMKNEQKKRHLFILSALLVLTLASAVLHVRWTYYVQPVAIILAAGLLPALCRARKHELFKIIGSLPVLIRCLVVIILMSLALRISTTIDVNEFPQHFAVPSCLQQSEYVIETQQLQNVLGTSPTIVFTKKDLGGAMMFFTPYRVIAQNYVREYKGMKDMADIEKQATPVAALPLLKARQIGAIFICPDAYAKDSWLHKLKNPKDVPAWMRQLTGLRFSDSSAKTPLLFTVSHQP